MIKKIIALSTLFVLANAGIATAATKPAQCTGTYTNTFTVSGSNGGFVGTSGNDLIYVTGHYNQIVAGDGDDCVVVEGTNNKISAGNGNDVVVSTGAFTDVAAGAGNDYVSVSSNSRIVGGDGVDTCVTNSSTSYKATCEL